MLNMIRQFTFHKPKEILQPTLWLFLSQACSMLPAILAYMAIYTLGLSLIHISFGSRRRAAMMMLGDSRMLVGRK